MGLIKSLLSTRCAGQKPASGYIHSPHSANIRGRDVFIVNLLESYSSRGVPE